MAQSIMSDPTNSPRLNRNAFSVSSLYAESDEKSFWVGKTPLERLEALEQMRQILYGYDPVTNRLQRVLVITQRTSG